MIDGIGILPIVVNRLPDDFRNGFFGCGRHRRFQDDRRSDSALVVVEDHGISRNRVGLERLGSEQAVGFVLNSPADEIIGVHPLPRTADGDEQFLVPGLGVGLGGRLYSGGGYHIFPIVRFLSRFVRLFFRRQFQFVEIDGRRGLLRREQRFARNAGRFLRGSRPA